MSAAMLHGLGDCTPEQHCGCLSSSRVTDPVQAKAEAWDEGFDAGHQNARAVNPEWPESPPNPYQEADQ